MGCGRRHCKCHAVGSGQGPAADRDVGGEQLENGSIGDHCSRRLFPQPTEQLPVKDFHALYQSRRERHENRPSRLLHRGWEEGNGLNRSCLWGKQEIGAVEAGGPEMHSLWRRGARRRYRGKKGMCERERRSHGGIVLQLRRGGWRICSGIGFE